MLVLVCFLVVWPGADGCLGSWAKSSISLSMELGNSTVFEVLLLLLVIVRRMEVGRGSRSKQARLNEELYTEHTTIRYEGIELIK